MAQICFLVQGSAKEPYRVTFQRSGNNLSAYCTCPAAENGLYCKHRINILGGIIDGIVSNNEEELNKIASWLPGTDVEEAFNLDMEAEVKFEIARRELSLSKKRLAKALSD